MKSMKKSVQGLRVGVGILIAFRIFHDKKSCSQHPQEETRLFITK